MQCHFCGHPLTAELRSCPICGTKILVSRRAVEAAPSASRMPPAPLRNQQPLGVRRQGCGWVALVLLLPTLSLLALLVALLEQAWRPTETLSLGQLLQLTAPLMLIVVCFTMASYPVWTQGTAHRPWLLLLGLLVLCALSSWLALAVGPCGAGMWQSSSGDFAASVLGGLRCTWHAYGWRTFLLCLLLGVGVGWAWSSLYFRTAATSSTFLPGSVARNR